MKRPLSRILVVFAALAWIVANAACAGTGQNGSTNSGMLAPSAITSAGAGNLVALTVTGPNYDGTGIWSQDPSCHHDCFQLDLVQNARGDLTLRDGFCASVNCHVDILLRRDGGRPKTGTTSTYSVSITGLPADERACINQTGSAQIDSSSTPNVLTINVTGMNWQGSDCQAETDTIVLEK